jgi:hypothetical protein
MLINQSDSASYVEIFKRKFANFCEKSPLRLSFTTTPQGVQITDVDNNRGVDIDWEFSVHVKGFIYGIKQILIEKGYYPYLEKVETTERPMSTEEQISLASRGFDIETLPTMTVTQKHTTYRIDKVIMFKDIFIFQEESTGKMLRYHLNGSSSFFLKDLRSGKFTPKTGADYFFRKADFMNELISKPDTDHNDD